ncbi:hypothetical protein HanRHA438_Chr09g0410111 [Helianthus annuus]|nr:hypothetical protein HanRHA438_Chr09g0410111 [Helianthus annuus]
MIYYDQGLKKHKHQHDPSLCVFPSISLRSNPLIMAAPVTRDLNSAVVCYDPNITRNNDINPSSAEENFIPSQLTNILISQPHVPCDPSKSKRRKSKPTRFVGFQTDTQKEGPSPKINTVRICFILH